MVEVFISYRREDSGWAGRIAERLGQGGRLNVFLDTTNIDSGDDFPYAIQNAVERSDAVLVLIGRGWHERIDELENDNDWVRCEIELALRHEKLIIPVLADNQHMPGMNDLPDTINEFVHRDGPTISNNNFGGIIAQLRKKVLDAFSVYQASRTWATLNGLYSVLKLVPKHSSGSIANLDNIQALVITLVPHEFSDQFPDQETEFPLDERDQVLFHNLLMPGVSYKAFTVNEKATIQIGIHMSKTSSVIVIYQQLLQEDKTARAIVVGYDIDPTEFAIEAIANCFDEPQFAGTDYRLPYKSAFLCNMMNSQGSFRHQYAPYDEDIRLKGELFAELFSMGIIGSKKVDCESIRALQSTLLEDANKYTIIHALEFEQPRQL